MRRVLSIVILLAACRHAAPVVEPVVTVPAVTETVSVGMVYAGPPTGIIWGASGDVGTLIPMTATEAQSIVAPVPVPVRSERVPGRFLKSVAKRAEVVEQVVEGKAQVVRGENKQILIRYHEVYDEPVKPSDPKTNWVAVIAFLISIIVAALGLSVTRKWRQ